MIPFKLLQVEANPLELDAMLKKEVPGYPGDPGSAEVVTYFVASAFGVIDQEPDERILERSRALQTLHVSDAPWNDALVFEKVAIALNGIIPDHHLLEAASAAELALAVTVMNKIKKKTPEWGREVITYIRGAMREWGVNCYPKVLTFAQEEFDNPDLRKLCSSIQSSSDYKAIHQDGIIYVPDDSDTMKAQLHKLSLVQEYVNIMLK